MRRKLGGGRYQGAIHNGVKKGLRYSKNDIGVLESGSIDVFESDVPHLG
jgi:hypothetical protein